MSEHRLSDYTFLGLRNNGNPEAPKRANDVAYLVALVDSTDHPIIEPQYAADLISLVFDVDEDHSDPAVVVCWQDGALPPGFLPQTPVILASAWSPISALLERQFLPFVLQRTPEAPATASGIWFPQDIFDAKSVSESQTDEELFWAIMTEAARRATVRKKMISIVAKAGWSYLPYLPGEVGLDTWDSKQLAQADKILWQRTPKK